MTRWRTDALSAAYPERRDMTARSQRHQGDSEGEMVTGLGCAATPPAPGQGFRSVPE